MNEEFERRWERKVEFLLNQQAKFDAELVEMQKVQAEIHAKVQAETDKKFKEAAETVSSLTTLVFEGFKITDARVKALAESQKRLQESHKEMQQEIAESNKLTHEKLKDLTALFDRHLREGHHGSAN